MSKRTVRDGRVYIPVDDIPVRRAFLKSNKKLLLWLLIAGVFGGFIYSKWSRYKEVPRYEQQNEVGQERSSNHNQIN